MGQTPNKDPLRAVLVKSNYSQDVAGIISGYCRDGIQDFNNYCLEYHARQPYVPPDLSDIENTDIYRSEMMGEERLYHSGQIKYALSKCIYFTVNRFCQVVNVSKMDFNRWYYGVLSDEEIHDNVMDHIRSHGLSGNW